MLKCLLFLASYGALLILLTPPTYTGIIVVAVMFILGVVLACLKKSYKCFFPKAKLEISLVMGILLCAYFTLNFYYRWLPSSKMQAIAAFLHMPTETMLFIGTLLLAGLSLWVIYAGVRKLIQWLSGLCSRNQPVGDVVMGLIAAAVTAALAQNVIETTVFSMGIFKFLMNALIVAVVILVLYGLLGRLNLSVLFGSGIFMLISTVNAYVYRFRGRLFEPVDVFSAGTALNVIENYSLFPIPLKVFLNWGAFAVMLIVFFYVRKDVKERPSIKSRILVLAICAVSAAAVITYTLNLETYHWKRRGAEYSGYILDFVAKFKEIRVSEPDDYSPERISALADRYSTENSDSDKERQALPHIIVIMDESFSDLSVIGNLSTNTEVTPFISSLRENTVSGYVLTSVYGGNTANSEFEFLTGNSMTWLSPNSVPYQQYIHSSTYSMVSYLKSVFGYRCVAMHPFESTGWNRPAAYAALGFDERHFVDDFPQEKLVRDFVSDREMFEYLIDTYEAQKTDPLFIFGVTMQNHGGYDYDGDNYAKSIFLSDCGEKFSEAEQYLSLIHETDKAVEYLISYFRNVEEDVVIVFFGDHQPEMVEAFYETIGGQKVDTLEAQQKQYQVPFFIWANYDIPEKQIACTSLNYLSSYVYGVAGIELPPYNRFLQEMQDVIPAINTNGFYSADQNCYLPIDRANDEERQWLEIYEMLQYNSLFDSEHLNETFFPILE